MAAAESNGTASVFVGSGRSQNQQVVQGDLADLVRQIEPFEKLLGKGLYRGLLKAIARVWKPSQIQDMALLRKLLAHMQAAERGVRRLEAAVGLTGRESLAGTLKSMRLDSMERIDNLETLKEIVLKLEQVASKVQQRDSFRMRNREELYPHGRVSSQWRLQHLIVGIPQAGRDFCRLKRSISGVKVTIQ